MGAAKLPLYAYVDETGNTGHNLFDEDQPDFYTAALITKGDFDVAFGSPTSAIATRLGTLSLHGKELGLKKLESVAPEILRLLHAANATFFVSRVEKRYLLTTKAFDSLFDSGENAAVAWHHYNLRPLKIALAFRMAHLLDDETSRAFWACILEPDKDKALEMLKCVCMRLLSNLDRLPGEGWREIFRRGLEWARDHPESIQIHMDRRSARQGHFPNLVAFANLLEGLEDHSRRVKRRVARITHDTQSEFEQTLAAWHDLLSNASPEEIKWAGETHSMQRVAGSEFEVKADETSAGLQIVDIVLWLYRQYLKEKPLSPGCKAILTYVFEHGWESDFSFVGVGRMYHEKWDTIINTPLTDEQEVQARKMLAESEQARQDSMARYDRDGLPPFMRQVEQLKGG
ncbi:MAG: hypothetical protein GC190_10115 [Alphaproteobacteria bacterium]|nr:hypothetical protein [Alphaproteobacteria bacterium]